MSARSLIESALPVVYQEKVIPDGVLMCPHCREEIHEKSIGGDLHRTIHVKCGGEITLKPMSADERAWLDQFSGGAR